MAGLCDRGICPGVSARRLPVLDQRQPDDSTVGSGHVSASGVFERGNNTAHKGSVPGEAAIRGVDEPRNWPGVCLTPATEHLEVDDVIRGKDASLLQSGFDHVVVVEGSEERPGSDGMAVDAADHKDLGNDRREHLVEQQSVGCVGLP